MADIRIRWLLEVFDRGAGRKLLAENKAIQSSMGAVDAAQRRSAVSAAQADRTKQLGAARVATAREREAMATRTAATSSVQLGEALARERTSTAASTAAITKKTTALERMAVVARAAATASAAAGAAGAAGGGISRSGVATGVGIRTLGRGGGSLLGIGGAFGLVAATKAAVGFEQQMANVQGRLRGSQADLRALSDLAIKMGQKTSFSASEAAGAMDELAKQGFTVNQMFKVLPGTLDLAAASGTDLATAAAIQTSALKGFGLAVKDSTRVADVLAMVVNKTAVDMADLPYTFKYIAPVAKATGQNFEEMATAIGLMSNVSIKGSTAGTTLRAALVRLTKPTDEARTAMKTLGLTTRELQGPDGLIPLPEILQKVVKGSNELKKSGDETWKSQRNMALASIFGTQALSGMVEMVELGPKKFAKLNRALDDSTGQADKAANIMRHTVSGAWERFTGTLESSVIKLTRRAMPGLRSTLIDGARGISRFIRGMETGQGAGGRFANAIRGVGRSIKDAVSAIAPAVATIGGFALRVAELGAKFAGTKAGMVLMSAALGGFLARLAAGPIIAFVGWVSNLATAFYQARIGIMATAVAETGALIPGTIRAANAFNVLKAAMVSNPFGLIAVVIGTVAGALLGMSHSQTETKVSAEELADANDSLYESYKRLRDQDLDTEARKLRVRRANLSVASAQRELTKEQNKANPSARRLKELELALAEAKHEQKVATRDLRRSEEDHRRERQKADRTAATTIATGKRRISQLEGERDAIKENMDKIRKWSPLMHTAEEREEALRKEGEKLRAKEVEIANATASVNDAMRQAANSHIPNLIKRIKDLGLSMKDARMFAKRFADQWAAIDWEQIENSPTALQPLQNLPPKTSHASPRGGGRITSTGGLSRYQTGGMVPVMASPGEAVRFPNGQWGMIGGPRVAADNTPLYVPPQTEFYTDHGQQLLAGGASRAAALAGQMPHFRDGGKLKTRLPQWNHVYPAHGLSNAAGHARFSFSQTQAIAEDAGFRPSKAGQMAQIARGESSLYPGIISGDGGHGLWQMTPRVWGNLGRSWMNQLGGLTAMRNPVANARMAMKLYADAGGFSPWYGTKYLTGARERNPQLEKWAKLKGQRTTQTFKGAWRPEFGGVPKEKMDKYTRRSYLRGLTGEAFGTGYAGGQAGLRRLLNISGVEDLITAADVPGSRPTRKVRGYSSTSRPKARTPGGGSWNPGGGWGGSRALVSQALRGLPAMQGQSITSTKRSVAINGNQGSDHNTWNKTAYAADISPGSDALFFQLGRRLGIGATKGSWNIFANRPVDGYRSQLLWYAPDGSHRDHVHLGIKQMRHGGIVRMQGGGAIGRSSSFGSYPGMSPREYRRWRRARGIMKRIWRRTTRVAGDNRHRPSVRGGERSGAWAIYKPWNNAIVLDHALMKQLKDKGRGGAFEHLARQTLMHEYAHALQRGMNRRGNRSIEGGAEAFVAMFGKRVLGFRPDFGWTSNKYHRYRRYIRRNRSHHWIHRGQFRGGGIARMAAGGMPGATRMGNVGPSGGATRLTGGMEGVFAEFARLQALAPKLNYDAQLLLRTLADTIDDAHRFTFTNLVEMRTQLRKQIRRLEQGGISRQEGAQIQRLRAALDLVDAEMGRRTGLYVRSQEQLAAGLSRLEARVDQNLRQNGIDQASVKGIDSMLALNTVIRGSLEQQREALVKALNRAKKAGDKTAIAEIGDKLKDLDIEIGEAATRAIELRRERIRAAAQSIVDKESFQVQTNAGRVDRLSALQRLAAAGIGTRGVAAAGTSAGMRQQAQAIASSLPAMKAERDALLGQAKAALVTGDLDGYRSAILAAGQATTDMANAMADAAELVREAARKDAEARVSLRQFQLSRAQMSGSLLEARQRLAGTDDEPGAMVARANAIKSTFDELTRLRSSLYTQAQLLKSQGDTEGYQSALLAAESAGLDLANAMADAAELMKQAALTAAENLVNAAAHTSTMADLSQQRIELEQRLAHTFDTTGGAIERAAYITSTIIPALESEIAALQNQQTVALAQGEKDLANQIAEAIAGKQNEILQAQLDAQEETAENTEKMLNRQGSLAYEYGGQQFTDLVGAGTGV